MASESSVQPFFRSRCYVFPTTPPLVMDTGKFRYFATLHPRWYRREIDGEPRRAYAGVVGIASKHLQWNNSVTVTTNDVHPSNGLNIVSIYGPY